MSVGRIYRDRYFDKAPVVNGKANNLRTIRVLSLEPDGRWLVEVVTDQGGDPVLRPRKTRVKASTLASGYELVPATTTGTDDGEGAKTNKKQEAFEKADRDCDEDLMPGGFN